MASCLIGTAAFQSLPLVISYGQGEFPLGDGIPLLFDNSISENKIDIVLPESLPEEEIPLESPFDSVSLRNSGDQIITTFLNGELTVDVEAMGPGNIRLTVRDANIDASPIEVGGMPSGNLKMTLDPDKPSVANIGHTRCFSLPLNLVLSSDMWNERIGFQMNFQAGIRERDDKVGMRGQARFRIGVNVPLVGGFQAFAACGAIFAHVNDRIMAARTCEVNITGRSRVISGRKTLLNAAATPGQGRFQWLIEGGADKVSLLNEGQSREKTIQAEKASESLDDVGILVEYESPTGAMCCTVHHLTVLQPSGLELKEILKTRLPNNLGWQNKIAYRVLDQFGNRLQVENAEVRQEIRVPESGPSNNIAFNPRNVGIEAKTRSGGEFEVSFIVVRPPMFPENTNVVFEQDIFVSDFLVKTNRILLDANNGFQTQ